MRIILLALALFPAAAIARDGDEAGPPKSAALCQNARAQNVDTPPATVQPRTLEQQPVANRYLGVLRFRDGCDRPVMARDNLDQGVDAKP